LPPTPASKKKVTFYLPEDLLRAARVHAARTDKRESQVVEDALRAHLAFGTGADLWDRPRSEPSARRVEPESNAPEPVPAEPTVPPEPLGGTEALALAVAELHALRAERRASRP
jgi:hypothetical protein